MSDNKGTGTGPEGTLAILESKKLFCQTRQLKEGKTNCTMSGGGGVGVPVHRSLMPPGLQGCPQLPQPILPLQGSNRISISGQDPQFHAPRTFMEKFPTLCTSSLRQ